MSEEKETFEDFRKSFSYGERSDMNFKFLGGLSDEKAADFIQGLFGKLGDALDAGDFGAVVEHIIAGQVQGYSSKGRFVYDEGPFTPLCKSLPEVRLGLLTSTGHYIQERDPQPFGVENMTQAEAEARIMEFVKGDPHLVSIPFDTALDDLRVRHGGYDIAGVQADPNTAFPLTRLTELAQANLIGSLTPTAWTFVGACSQMRLKKRFLPAWIEEIKQGKPDAMLLVPV